MMAGMIAAVVFAISNLPMVGKALRTHDVGSYSLGSIGMINAANVVYSLYVFSLPFGPIWMLHSFYLIASAIMLVLCVRARRRPAPARIAASVVRRSGDGRASEAQATTRKPRSPVGSRSAVLSEVTSAPGGPSSSHPSIASTAAGSPSISASTAPSLRLRTQPDTPRRWASTRALNRKPTAWTRPWTTTRCRIILTPFGPRVAPVMPLRTDA